MKLNTLVLLLCFFSANTYASVQDEINYLLDYVSKTDCKYERNGTVHNGKEAVNHINKKYDYFKEDIKSTEDFIRYSATKSKMSGKHYVIHCDGQKPVKSQDWLLEVLGDYRAEKQ